MKCIGNLLHSLTHHTLFQLWRTCAALKRQIEKAYLKTEGTCNCRVWHLCKELHVLLTTDGRMCTVTNINLGPNAWWVWNSTNKGFGPGCQKNLCEVRLKIKRNVKSAQIKSLFKIILLTETPLSRTYD